MNEGRTRKKEEKEGRKPEKKTNEKLMMCKNERRKT